MTFSVSIADSRSNSPGETRNARSRSPDLELGDGQRRVREQLEDDLPDLRRALEVVGVGVELDRLVGDEVGELVRAGPDRGARACRG